MSNAADWFERNLKAAGKTTVLTDDHRRCLNVLSSICALYNIPGPGLATDLISIWPTGGISCITSTELSTYDFDGLTRLVTAAHRNFVRVSIGPWYPHHDEERAKAVAGYLTQLWERDQPVEWDDPEVSSGLIEITLHPRQKDGGPYERHPGMEIFQKEMA